MKKMFSSLVIATTLVLSATAALADSRVADHRYRPMPPAPVIVQPRPDFKPVRPAPIVEQSIVASERAFGRRGVVSLNVRGVSMKRDLFLLTSDGQLDIRFVRITYAGGKTVMLRGSNARSLDLPDGGRIRSIEVSYVNRGARGAMIQLVARGHGNDHDGHGWDRGRGRGQRGFAG